MERSLSKRKKIYVVLLSLLIHIILLYVIFFTRMHEGSYTKLLEKVFEKQKDEAKQWVNTKARSSDFGATILFQDEPEFMQSPEPPATQEEKRAQESSLQQPEPAKAEPLPEKQPQELVERHEPREQENAEKKDSTLLTTVTKKTAERPETTPKLKEKQETSKTKSDPQPEPQKKAPPTQEEKMVPPARHMTRMIEQPPEFGNKDASPIKKKITMADIAKGFLHQIKNEGEHHVAMLGNDHGKVTAEQLKYERYIQRILWCIQNSEKIHRHKLNMQQSVSTKLLIRLTLARSGRPISINLVERSGFSELDEYYLFIFKDASSAFPPVPNYLKDDPLRFGIQVNIEMMANKSPFGFSIS